MGVLGPGMWCEDWSNTNIVVVVREQWDFRLRQLQQSVGNNTLGGNRCPGTIYVSVQYAYVDRN